LPEDIAGDAAMDLPLTRMIFLSPRTPRPEIAFDDEREIITINGNRYSYALFESLGVRGLEAGAVIKILERRDGAVVFKRLYDLEEGKG